MADRVKESGSWAQSEVIQTLQDNGVLPSHANEAIALADVIGSTAKSYAENAELVEELKGKKQLTFKIFKNGVFAPVSVLVDYSNGSNVEKAIAKAIASVATAEMVGLAAGALLNPATAPFAIAIGTVAAGYFAAGFVANKIGKAYDVWIGPDVESKGYDSNGYRQLESNYSVKDTLLLEEYHQNISIYEDDSSTTLTVTYKWKDDEIHNRNGKVVFIPKIDVEYHGKEDVNVKVYDGHTTLYDEAGNPYDYQNRNAQITIYDDDDENRYDPLVLDTNKDGFISTSSLDDSNTYFDITGDGLRERIGWIKSEDALVAYDKNDNNQIDGIDEVFGNLSESGFEEIKRLIEVSNNISYKKIEAV